MLGIVFKELRSYLTARSGPDAWYDVLRDAGLPGRAYLTTDEYPDAELTALIEAAAARYGTAPAALVEDLGAFLVPGLLSVYKAFVKPEWGLFDLLEHTEDTMHRAVRLSDAHARPPSLRVERLGPSEVAIEYASPRRLCALAKGIVRGAAAQFGTGILLTEPRCMQRGDPACRIEVAAA